MNNAKYLSALIWISILISLGIAYLEYANLWDFFKILVTTVVVLHFLTEHCLWKCPVIRSYFNFAPDIAGTWQGTITSTYKRDGVAIPPIPAYVAVKQTASSIKIRLMTQESKSELINGQIYKDAGVFKIAAVYLNDPKADFRGQSALHYGSFILEIHAEDRLDGSYWTDRKTTGDLLFAKRIKKNCTSFEECAKQKW